MRAVCLIFCTIKHVKWRNMQHVTDQMIKPFPFFLFISQTVCLLFLLCFVFAVQWGGAPDIRAYKGNAFFFIHFELDLRLRLLFFSKRSRECFLRYSLFSFYKGGERKDHSFACFCLSQGLARFETAAWIQEIWRWAGEWPRRCHQACSGDPCCISASPSFSNSTFRWEKMRFLGCISAKACPHPMHR